VKGRFAQIPWGGAGGGAHVRACVRVRARACACLRCTRRLTCPLLPNVNAPAKAQPRGGGGGFGFGSGSGARRGPARPAARGGCRNAAAPQWPPPGPGTCWVLSMEWGKYVPITPLPGHGAARPPGLPRGGPRVAFWPAAWRFIFGARGPGLVACWWGRRGGAVFSAGRAGVWVRGAGK
jgi:hypothetical protein